jgi:hypothetical protein
LPCLKKKLQKKIDSFLIIGNFAAANAGIVRRASMAAFSDNSNICSIRKKIFPATASWLMKNRYRSCFFYNQMGS